MAPSTAVPAPRAAAVAAPTTGGPAGAAGLIGALVALAVVGIAPGPLRALLVAGPASTFALPWLGAVAEWRLGWGLFRGRGLAATWGRVALVAAGTAVTLLGTQALAWRVSPATMLTSGAGTLAWPWLMPHGALAFVGFVQLSSVSEARGRLTAARPAVRGAALAGCFAVAGLLPTALVDWSGVRPPPAAPPRWHGGPLPAFDLLTWLACAAAAQVLYGLLGGWPAAAIGRRRLRVAAANALVLGCATVVWAGLRHGLDVPGPRLAAGCALWVAGGVMAARTIGGRAGRVQLLLLAACYAVALGLPLAAVASLQDWPAGIPAELWLVVCGLNLVPGAVLAAGGVLHRAPGGVEER